MKLTNSIRKYLIEMVDGISEEEVLERVELGMELQKFLIDKYKDASDSKRSVIIELLKSWL